MADMTPAAWLALLEGRMDERQKRLKVLDDYYEGRHPMAFATSRFREAFGGLLETLSDNWCRIVVTSSARRLKVQGFRFGSEQSADEAAWAIWQANGMDAQSAMVHTEAIKLGEAYWLVEPPRDGGEPRITCEHPSQMIVATAPGDRSVRLAALKRWLDDDGYAYATLYLPRQIVKYRSAGEGHAGPAGPVDARPGDEGGRNPLGEVPVVPVCNEPQMLGGGTSDIEPGIPIQNAIDKLCADMVVASEYAAYRQRVMTGVELPRTRTRAAGPCRARREPPVHGRGAGREGLRSRGERPQELRRGDRDVHPASRRADEHTAALPAREDAQRVRRRARRRRVRPGVEGRGQEVPVRRGHEEAMRLAFRAKGDEERANALDAETLWAPSERRSFAQVVDGAVKLAQIGLPAETVMQELGWSPQRIAQVQVQRIAGDVFAPLTAPAAPANGSGPDAGV
jgi:hypothetical protein